VTAKTAEGQDRHAAKGAVRAPAPPAGPFDPRLVQDGQGVDRESALAPLRDPLFRILWTASVVSNVGTWMQNVGGAWLMTDLTPSPIFVALMQTATSLPIFLAGLPAGALADLVDRRKLLLVAQGWMLVVAATLGCLTLLHLMNPWLLLAFTFALGLGTAFNAPAWQAIIPEVVPRRRVPPAVALEAAGFNVARAAGPALGGLVVAWTGPGANFLLNAASFLATMIALYRWKRPERTSTLPAERLLSATRTGLRYARHAPELHAVLVRTTAFMVCASALWALLPQVARRELGLPSSGYGILLGSLGLGAVATAGVLPRVRERYSADVRLAAASVVFGLATLGLGFVRNLPLLCLIMAAAGAAWMIVTSGLNVIVQAGVPDWVKARALATFLLVFQGTLAAASLGWGILAEHIGDPPALAVAACGLILGVAVTWHWRLETTEQLDVRPSQLLPEPDLADAPDPLEGPVMVEAEYRVGLERAGEFVLAMRQLGRLRRRDGAMRWALFRDPAEPGRYIESFVVESWAEHLRQVERATLADRELDALARSFLLDAEYPTLTHLVAAQAPDHTGPIVDGV
jgi:MFS family permease